MNVYAWEGGGEWVWAHDEWVMSCRSTSHVTHTNVSYYSRTWMCMRDRRGASVFEHSMNASCHTSTSHVTYTNESYYRCTWVCMRDRGGASVFERSMNESRHVDQWVMSHIRMCHITGVHECVCVILGGECVWALDECVMSRRSMSHVTHMNFSYYSTWMSMCERGGWVCLSTRESCNTSMSHVTHMDVSYYH